jgi:hypothetical protein
LKATFLIGFSRLPFAALQVQAVRFTNLRYFFSQLSDTFFDGLLHEDRLAELSGAARLELGCAAEACVLPGAQFLKLAPELTHERLRPLAYLRYFSI